MSRPRISLAITSSRLGGLDCLLYSCAQQTLPNDQWEIVFADDYFDLRKDLVKEMASVFKLNVNHFKGPESEFYNNSEGMNRALAACEGVLVAFVIDNQWIYPNYLSDHLGFYKQTGYSMTGYLDRYPPPPLKQSIDILAESAPERLAWSVYEHEFTPIYAVNYFKTAKPEYHERKGGTVGPLHESGYHEMPGELIYMINEAVPLELLREVNGWDTRFDGRYGSNDCNLASRLIMAGHKFLLNPHSITQKLGTPNSSQVIPGIKRPKKGTPEENYRLHLDILDRIKRGEESVRTEFGAW